MQQEECKDNEVYNDKECFDSKSSAARKLLRDNKLNSIDRMKVGCEESSQVVNLNTGRCMEPKNITAKNLLKEQFLNKKLYFREKDVEKFSSKLLKKYKEQLASTAQGKKSSNDVQIKDTNKNPTETETKTKKCKDNEVLDTVSGICHGKTTTKARKLLTLKNNLSQEDRDKVGCEKPKQIINLQTGRCLDVDGVMVKNILKKDPQEINDYFRESDLVKFKLKGHTEVPVVVVDKEEIKPIEKADKIKGDNKDKEEEEKIKPKAMSKTKSQTSDVVMPSWSKEDDEEYEEIINLLRKYEETKSFKEKTTVRNDLLRKKYINSLENDRLNEHKEYVFDFNNEIQYDVDDKNNAFALSNNQKFVKKFISPHTGNTGILLFHGVGVGKTCSAIQIAENFLNFFDNKTLIIASKNLHGNFNKELFDIRKVDKKTKSYDGCIGNVILNNIPGWHKMTTTELQNAVNIVIKQSFSLLGYLKLVNKIEKIKRHIATILKRTQSDSPEKKAELYANYIRREFSDRVIIIDEAHNIRNPDLIKESKNKTKDTTGASVTTPEPKTKQIPIVLKDIMSHAKNVRLVLLSATPMFDKPTEIFGLADILMLNDKVSEINGSVFDESGEIKKNISIFDESGEIQPKLKDFFKYFSQNYVSYMRGENPLYFPLRLNPNIHSDTDKVVSAKDHPTMSFESTPLKDTNMIQHIQLYKSTMSKIQDNVITKLKSQLNIKNSTHTDDDIEKAFDDNQDKSNNVYTEAMQISSVYYPVDNVSRVSDKFHEVFDVVQSKQFLKLKYNDKFKNNEIFSETNVATYAPKIKSIIDCINKSEGIVLIYSEYIYAGIIPLCIALESHGYNKFGNKNMIKPVLQNSKGSYITITARADISGSDNEKEIELKKLVSKENLDGSSIKIVIINQVAAEGYDFKNVREIHILEPWYNLNRLEQVIGRGVRNRSHFDQPPEKHNVTIYMHCNLHRDFTQESIDYRTYRLAELKQYRISRIEKIMKEYSIDCALNKNIIHFKNLPRKTIVTSRNVEITDYDLNDRDGSRICNYDVCEVICNNSMKHKQILDDEDQGQLNANMLDYDITRVSKIIMNYFNKNALLFVSVEDLMLNVDEKDSLLKLALSNLTEKKQIFTVNKMNGYLNVVNNDYVVFLPETINAPSLTLVEQKNQDKQTRIDSIQLEFNELNDESIMSTFEKNKLELMNELDKLIEKKHIHHDIVNELIIDAFSYDELKSFINISVKIYDSFEKHMVKALNRTCMTKISDKEILTYNHYDSDRGFNIHLLGDTEDENAIVSTVSIKRLNDIGIFTTLKSYLPEEEGVIAYRSYTHTEKNKDNKVTQFKFFWKRSLNCTSIKIQDFKTKLKLSELDKNKIIKEQYKNILDEEEWKKYKKELQMNKVKSLCRIIEYILRYYKLMNRPIASILNKKK